jgi:hypothetical protein
MSSVNKSQLQLTVIAVFVFSFRWRVFWGSIVEIVTFSWNKCPRTSTSSNAGSLICFVKNGVFHQPRICMIT